MSGRQKEELQDITLLGNQNNKYLYEYDKTILESFDNKHQGRDYFVKFNCPEFTSLCRLQDNPTSLQFISAIFRISRWLNQSH